MIDADEILRMIENVSPDDVAKLDEIDWRVNWLLCKIRLGDGFTAPCDDLWFSARKRNQDCPQYTRSRDALKAIRPDGYLCNIYTTGLCSIWDKKRPFHADSNFRAEAPTEELAELHAIIQAIKYEREQHDKTKNS